MDSSKLFDETGQLSIPTAHFRAIDQDGNKVSFSARGTTTEVAKRAGRTWAEASKFRCIENYLNSAEHIVSGSIVNFKREGR